MCWKCGNPINADAVISRTSECPFCKTDLHSCRNCRFYDEDAHYGCHETVDELVEDKGRANFCDNFSARHDFSSGKSAGSDSAKARDAFNSLFGSIICR